MAREKKARTVNISISQGAFSSIFKRFAGEKGEYEFSGLADLRKLLSNEKAKILYSIKYSKPRSIYHLAKILKRDFKSVQQDVKFLERLGFVQLKPESRGKRGMLKPIIVVHSIRLEFEI